MSYFVNNESGYREWIKAHPLGFVLVSWNPPRANYTTLHRADCHTINPEKATHKENWTQKYIKVCADDISDIEDWASKKWGEGNHTLNSCKHCQKAGRL
jgi:hypothetical protein